MAAPPVLLAERAGHGREAAHTSGAAAGVVGLIAVASAAQTAIDFWCRHRIRQRALRSTSIEYLTRRERRLLGFPREPDVPRTKVLADVPTHPF
jgi:hypothetical protein